MIILDSLSKRVMLVVGATVVIGIGYKFYSLQKELNECKYAFSELEKAYIQRENDLLVEINTKNELVKQYKRKSEEITDELEKVMKSDMRTYDDYIQSMVDDIMKKETNVTVGIDMNDTSDLDIIFKVYKTTIGVTP